MSHPIHRDVGSLLRGLATSPVPGIREDVERLREEVQAMMRPRVDPCAWQWKSSHYKDRSPGRHFAAPTAGRLTGEALEEHIRGHRQVLELMRGWVRS